MESNTAQGASHPQNGKSEDRKPKDESKGGAQDKSNGESKAKGEKPLARVLGAEVAGTFALCFAAAGAEVVNAASGGQVEFVARQAAPGLMVMALIYAWSDISGAHFNPAVTLAFVLRRDLPPLRGALYVAAQLAGAILAALMLKALFVTSASGLTRPHLGVPNALGMEVILSLFLLLVIINTSIRHGEVRTEAALAVGATIILDGFIGSRASGASMNPARSLGPALVEGSLHNQWIYLVGPCVGAALAVGLSGLLHGGHNEGEEEAAQGE